MESFFTLLPWPCGEEDKGSQEASTGQREVKAGYKAVRGRDKAVNRSRPAGRVVGSGC